MMKHSSEDSGFSPEARLLLQCARVHMDSGRAEEIRRLAQQKLDWLMLLGMAITVRTAGGLSGPLHLWRITKS